jgi:iron complex outermembrane receptor protein
VQKTASAETDEGSLGATIDLITGRPLNFKGRRMALSLQDAYYDAGKHHNPRVAGLISDRWDTNWGQFGALFSLAYNKRNTTSDSYGRSPGQSDYAYRGATFATTPNPVATAASPSVSTLIRQGFAAPDRHVVQQRRHSRRQHHQYGGLLGAGRLQPHRLRPDQQPDRRHADHGPQSDHGSVDHLDDRAGFADPHSGAADLNQQQLEQERMGLTGSVQWRAPDQRTTVSVDGVYSRFYNDSQNFGISLVGLNRNNTNATYNTANAATTAANKRGLYNTCTARAASAIVDAIDCGQEKYGTTPVAGTLSGFSFNPNNLEPYDYYNSPTSVGYIASADGLALRDAMIGRPSVKLIDAALSPGGANAEYLKLGNVDVRSADDQQTYTTFFQQGSINLEHEFSDRLKMTAIYGRSRSVNKSTGLLADYIRLDSGQGVAGNDYIVFDERGGGDMPILNLGFDAANPANWDFVKNYSALRIYRRVADNHYEGGRIDLAYEVDDSLTIKTGLSQRKYSFFTTQFQRTVGETLNPSFKEANSSVAATSRLIEFGQSIDLPAGTATSFLAPTTRSSSISSASTATASTSGATGGPRPWPAPPTPSASTRRTPAPSCSSTTTPRCSAAPCAATSARATP